MPLGFPDPRREVLTLMKLSHHRAQLLAYRTPTRVVSLLGPRLAFSSNVEYFGIRDPDDLSPFHAPRLS